MQNEGQAVYGGEAPQAFAGMAEETLPGGQDVQPGEGRPPDVAGSAQAQVFAGGEGGAEVPAERDEAEKPRTDREWGAWRKKTQAKAAALAAKQTAKLDGEVAARFGHLRNPLTGQPVKTAEDYFAALKAREQVAEVLQAIDGEEGGARPGAWAPHPEVAAGALAAGLRPLEGGQAGGRDAAAGDSEGFAMDEGPAASAPGILPVEEGNRPTAQQTGLPGAVFAGPVEDGVLAQAGTPALWGAGGINPVDAGVAGEALQVQPAALLALQAGEAARRMAQAAQLAVGDRLLDEQVAEISRLDPEVRCFEDLVRMDSFAAFDRMVKSGQDLVSAYKAANFEKLARARQAAARQAALNHAAGKSHMARLPAAAGDDGGREIPPGALSIWRELFPEEDDARLRARFNRAARG